MHSSFVRLVGLEQVSRGLSKRTPLPPGGTQEHQEFQVLQVTPNSYLRHIHKASPICRGHTEQQLDKRR